DFFKSVAALALLDFEDVLGLPEEGAFFPTSDLDQILGKLANVEMVDASEFVKSPSPVGGDPNDGIPAGMAV
ncbi:9598_t:CDS:2, partial [Gigaspora rosea]